MHHSFQCNARLLGITLAACIAATGCSRTATDHGVDTSAPPTKIDAHHHALEGPHHGSLIELGNEAYHAELVHDKQAGSITVYVLDSTAKTAMPIDAQELIVNLSHDGQAEQFTLSANPETSDPAGQSSRFSSVDADVVRELDHDHAEAQLVVTLKGKQYRGSIRHHHDEGIEQENKH